MSGPPRREGMIDIVVEERFQVLCCLQVELVCQGQTMFMLMDQV